MHLNSPCIGVQSKFILLKINASAKIFTLLTITHVSYFLFSFTSVYHIFTKFASVNLLFHTQMSVDGESESLKHLIFHCLLIILQTVLYLTEIYIFICSKIACNTESIFDPASDISCNVYHNLEHFLSTC
jgi:hypothetical protein